MEQKIDCLDQVESISWPKKHFGLEEINEIKEGFKIVGEYDDLETHLESENLKMSESSKGMPTICLICLVWFVFFQIYFV